MNRTIGDQVYGCLIGGAIGDALGAPVEGWTSKQIREEYGKLDSFKHYHIPYSNREPGSVTSDTTLRQYLCLAITQSNGQITPEVFAGVITNYMNTERVWINEEIVLRKLNANMDPWTTGKGTVPDNKMTGAITPIGIINAGDPRRAYQDGFNIASVLQEGHYRHSSATLAAGIAEAITPNATVESVLETMTEYAPEILTRGIHLINDVAKESATVDEFVEQVYDQHLDWRWPPVEWDQEKYARGEVFSASTLEVLPVAMALLDMCEGDVNQSIIEGVNYGRDSDSIASIAGSIAGTIHGASEIRSEWQQQCEEANRDFFEELEGDRDADFRLMADRMVSVIDQKKERAENRARFLEEILEE